LPSLVWWWRISLRSVGSRQTAAIALLFPFSPFNEGAHKKTPRYFVVFF
jgi:hypothetical protein